jgi:hypothetical protein
MVNTYYKAVRPNLASFHDPEYIYRIGGTHRPRTPRRASMELCTDLVLHASLTPEQACRYARWPWRLLEVTGTPVVQDHEKAGFRQLVVIQEVPVERSFGPNGSAVLAIVRQAESMTLEQAQRLRVDTAWDAAWHAAGDAAWDAARDTARYDARYAARAAAEDAVRDPRPGTAAWDAAWHAGYAARAAAWGAVRAAVVADLVGQHGLTQDHIDTLMAPWHSVFGKENA